MVFLGGSCAEAQVSFRGPDFKTGRGPRFVAVTDLNRDGLPDVITANTTDNTISVLLNNGNGTFARHTDYPVGKDPRTIVTADFNNDGIPDIAVTNRGDNTVSVFLGRPDGTLQALGAFATDREPDAMVVGDFNHDGKTDLAFSSANATFTVYFGNGDGTFTFKTAYIVGALTPGGSMLAADFNHDGILDLAVQNGSSVVILLGQADGSFVPVSFLSASGTTVGRMGAADFNQDGNIDLVVQFTPVPACGCAGPVMVFGGHGDGTFDAGHVLFLSDDTQPLVVADFNGDGNPDIGVPRGILLTDPATVFSGGPFTPIGFPAAGLGPQALAVGDFDHDGKVDVITANFSDDTISLLHGNGDGTFHQPQRYPLTIEPSTVATADFNGDGFPDIAVCDEIVVGVQLFAGKGNGTLSPLSTVATDMQVLRILTADLNHDGIPDLVLAGIVNNTLALRVLLGIGDGTFRALPDITGGVGDLAVADFNRDGKLDVAMLSVEPILRQSMRLQIFLGNGDGTFGAPINIPLGYQAAGLAVGDFNGDGIPDLVLGRNSLQVIGNEAVFLGNGDGTFRNSANYTAGSGGGKLVVADFNHDGILDFVAFPDLFLGNGDGTFTQRHNVISVPGDFQVADVNGDGLPDLVVGGFRVSVFINNGDGTFQPRVEFSSGGAAAIALADFNSDGRLDIVAAGGALTLLLNETALSGRDFQLQLSSQSLMVDSGQPGTVVTSVNSLGQFAGSVTFSCLGLPAGMTCSFNPAQVMVPSGASATSALTINVSSLLSSKGHSTAPDLLAFAGLPVFAFALLLAAGKKKSLAVLLCVLAGAVLLSGCGGVQSGVHQTGPFTVNVVATSSGSTAIVHSQQLVVNLH